MLKDYWLQVLHTSAGLPYGVLSFQFVWWSITRVLFLADLSQARVILQVFFVMFYQIVDLVLWYCSKPSNCPRSIPGRSSFSAHPCVAVRCHIGSVNVSRCLRGESSLRICEPSKPFALLLILRSRIGMSSLGRSPILTQQTALFTQNRSLYRTLLRGLRCAMKFNERRQRDFCRNRPVHFLEHGSRSA